MPVPLHSPSIALTTRAQPLDRTSTRCSSGTPGATAAAASPHAQQLPLVHCAGSRRKRTLPIDIQRTSPARGTSVTPAYRSCISSPTAAPRRGLPYVRCRSTTTARSGPPPPPGAFPRSQEAPGRS